MTVDELIDTMAAQLNTAMNERGRLLPQLTYHRAQLAKLERNDEKFAAAERKIRSVLDVLHTYADTGIQINPDTLEWVETQGGPSNNSAE